MNEPTPLALRRPVLVACPKCRRMSPECASPGSCHYPPGSWLVGSEARTSNLQSLLMRARSEIRMSQCTVCGRHGYNPNQDCSNCIDRLALENDLLSFPVETTTAHEREMEKALEERDANADYADQLTAMIGVYFEHDHGEHTSGNFPWENAIETMRVAIGTKGEPPSVKTT